MSDQIMSIPAGETTVRFLTEPDQWISYQEHYTKGKGFFPCTAQEGQNPPMCPGCNGTRASSRWLAPAVHDNKVVVARMPTVLAQVLDWNFKRFGTVTDQDYELWRQGSGLDTTYNAVPSRNIVPVGAEYEVPDLVAVLDAYAKGDR